ncbi:MAG: dipeptidase [Clostridia bacterium]
MNISDSHNDFVTAMAVEDQKQYINSINNCGGCNVGCAVFTENMNISNIIECYKHIKDLQQYFYGNLIFSIEDLSCVKTLDELNSVIDLKPFSATLTWNYANQFAGGADSKQGLTPLGKLCIDILERNNILVDTAHLSRKAFYDLCKISKLPIYNSHSNIYTLKRHNRNLTDKQIEIIVKTGGYLGLTLYDKFISNNKISSKDIALQFDYLITRFGYKNFGLGTDFYGIDNTHLPIDIKAYQDIINLVKELKILGYNNNVVDSLLFKNFDNFVNRMYF